MFYVKHPCFEETGGDGDAGAGAGGTSGTSGTASGSPPTRPEELPEKFWDEEAHTVRLSELVKSYVHLERTQSAGRDQLRETLAKELEAERRKGLPETPDGYVIPPPEKLGLPEGAKLEVLDDDPMLGFFRETAHKFGIPPEEFEKGVALYVQNQLGVDPETELKKLGETGPQRMENVRSALKSRLSENELAGISPAIVDADAFVAIEKLLLSSGVIEPVTSNPGSGAGGTGGGDTRGSLETAMNDERYWHPAKRDPAYIADIQARFSRLFPGKHKLG